MCESKDSFKFHIDKTYATLFEIGKRFTNSIGVSILLLTFTVILTLGKIVGENLDLPFIGLKLERLYVAEIAAVLTCASVYRTLSLVMYERLIRFRLERLLIDSGWDTVTWALEYPSVFYLARRISEIFETEGRTLIRLLASIIITFCLVPFGCLIYLGCHNIDSVTVWFALLLTIVLIFATAYIYFTTPKLGERDDTLDKLNVEAAPVKPEHIKISSKKPGEDEAGK